MNLLRSRDCFRLWVSPAVIVLGACVLAGCSTQEAPPAGSPSSTSSSSAGSESPSASPASEIVIDGSSTVMPISAVMSEVFLESHPGVKISSGVSGTSSGFSKLIAGEIMIAGASRPISEKELSALKEKGVEVLELQVALDGLTVVVNKDNDWCSSMTIDQLQKLWAPGSTVSKWSELDPNWPDTGIKLFGAGTNSGTFEYFTEAVCQTKKKCRSDYTPSENDNELVIGVAADKGALGYFGYSYFDENRDKLHAVKIAPRGADPAAAVEPTAATIESGEYRPLSRPLFIYVNKAALKQPSVRAFLEFYMSDEGQELVSEAHCIKMNAAQLEESRKRLADALQAAG